MEEINSFVKQMEIVLQLPGNLHLWPEHKIPERTARGSLRMMLLDKATFPRWMPLEIEPGNVHTLLVRFHAFAPIKLVNHAEYRLRLCYRYYWD